MLFVDINATLKTHLFIDVAIFPMIKPYTVHVGNVASILHPEHSKIFPMQFILCLSDSLLLLLSNFVFPLLF